ncbi:MAG TPA: helicase RepA family protein [Acidocella sp.]|jgi:hypothetical protein|uniref:AAA family ATPase n=1 Tax=Halothiobacillus sp. 15-55-196 TaxID=1970382 RepID=UPI000BD3D288|nr:helicase RepA family protein [Halothiobacillus sp. 15-55-196]OZB36174.1 MAG: hypothetical protein B7X44_07175 [Halothiobacillus sp. 15-55-196]HQT38123.1 helicase RepA family protein [Acidocella sp.]
MKGIPSADKPGAEPRKVPLYIDSTLRRGTIECSAKGKIPTVTGNLYAKEQGLGNLDEIEATRQGWINPSKQYSKPPEPSKTRETRDQLLIPVPILLSQPAAPQWLVRGFLEKNVLGMIFGASGHGKSFIGLALAASVATGTDFFGRAVAPGGVVYVAGEGHQGIARRLKAWEIHAEQILPDSFTVSSRAVRFLDTADMALLASEIEAMSVRPTLIVVDTVARAMVGADENSSKEMGAFIAECDALKRRFNCTLLLIHHSGHGEATRARGSSSLKAAMDFEALVIQQEGRRSLFVSKMKDAEPPSQIHFDLLSVELPWLDDDGLQVSAAVVVQVERSEPPPKKLKMSPTQRLGVQTLLSVANNGTATLEAWRREFHKGHTGDTPDAKKKAFQRVRKDLTEAAAVTVEDDDYTITPDKCVWVDFAVMVKAAQ